MYAQGLLGALSITISKQFVLNLTLAYSCIPLLCIASVISFPKSKQSRRSLKIVQVLEVRDLTNLIVQAILFMRVWILQTLRASYFPF
jgi:hypothetical protein